MPRILTLLLLLTLPLFGSLPTLAQEPEVEVEVGVPNSTSPSAQPLTPPASSNPMGSYTAQEGIVASIGGSGPTFYAYPLVKTLSQSYFKLTGIDLGDDKLVDDFASIHFCDIMKQYYADEFSWRQAREAVRNFITRNLEDYPEHFVLQGTLNLGRYDFGKKAFLLEGKSELRRTGIFQISSKVSPDCGNYRLQTVPYNFTFRLTNPITLDAIEMPENKAFALTRRMEAEGNMTRTVYLTFYLRVNDFSSGVSSQMGASDATVRATLLSMRMYYGPDRKEMLYEYTGE